jgi:hypothetical protein
VKVGYRNKRECLRRTALIGGMKLPLFGRGVRSACSGGASAKNQRDSFVLSEWDKYYVFSTTNIQHSVYTMNASGAVSGRWCLCSYVIAEKGQPCFSGFEIWDPDCCEKGDTQFVPARAKSPQTTRSSIGVIRVNATTNRHGLFI